MTQPSRILVRGPNWIGDHVMARSFYEGLRAAFPRAELTLLVAEAAAGLAYPHVFSRVRPLRGSERKGPGGRDLARELAAGQYHLAVTLPASVSAALLLWRAGIPERIGFAEPGAGFFLTRARRWRGRASGRHKADLYRALGELIAGHEFPLAAEAPPRTREPLLLLAPGASLPLREWPYFAELVPQLRRRYPGYRLAVVGAPSDAKWSTILGRLGDDAPEDLIGRTSLEELRALCGRAAAVIANDSGVAHVAAESGAPTLVLFGPGDAKYIAPRGAPVVAAAAAGVPCQPCESARCRNPDYQQCLRELAPDTVMARLAELAL